MTRIVGIVSLSVMCCCGAFAASISLQPSTTTLALGSPLKVDVNVMGIPNLYAFQFDIGFNPAVLSAANVTEGPLFTSIGVFFSPGVIDNIAGTITFIGDSLSGPGPGVSTDGTLASIMFSGIRAGSSGITLGNVVLLDSNLNDIVAAVSGVSVTVSGASAVPEPATFMLLLPALVAIGSRIRLRLS